MRNGGIIIPSTRQAIPHRLQYLAELFPHRELFVFYNGATRSPYTSRQIFQLAGKFANRLRYVYGFRRHDIIANTLPNSPERLVTDLGIAMAGCTCMTGQILLADGSDFFRSAKLSRCAGVIVRPGEDASSWLLLSSFIPGNISAAVSNVSCDQAPELRLAIFASRRGDCNRKPLLEDLRDSEEDTFLEPAISPDDLHYIFVTSGSTGYSKMVPRSHRGVLEVGATMDIKEIALITGHDTVLYNDRSFGWAGGYPYPTYNYGQKRVLQDWFEGHGKKKSESIWLAICRERCNMAILRQIDVDSLLSYIASIGGPDYQVKLLETAGQPLTQVQLASLFTITDEVMVVYGSTEAGAMAVGSFTSPEIGDFFCGKPADNLQVNIVDDNGDPCKPRQTGTVHIKGGVVFKGYFNLLQDPDPDTVKCFTKDGWFNTEDVGYQDEDGNLYVMGRNKDTIMYGSVVLYPGWLEAKIYQHPDVAEACILPMSDGHLETPFPPAIPTHLRLAVAMVSASPDSHTVPCVYLTHVRTYIYDARKFRELFKVARKVSDPVLFQNICACVKQRSGSDLNEDKLKRICENIFIADLASEQTPMPQYFMVLESFPETPSGKPDKQTLAKMAEQRFGKVRASNAVVHETQ